MVEQSYGATRAAQNPGDPGWLSEALESLERVGFAVLPDALEPSLVTQLGSALDRLLQEQTARAGGDDALQAIGESGQVRAPCCEDSLFWSLIEHPVVDCIVERLLGPAAIVLQQNGVVMPAAGQRHQQQRWHRDLPYQSWVNSAPIALGFLCTLDPFNGESGGTTFLPASHRFPHLPSDAFIRGWEHGVDAPAGSLVVFDAMTFHRGGTNRSNAPRRAVNTLFGIPLLAQQVTLDAPAGASPLAVRRSGSTYRPADSADDYRARRQARLGKAKDGQ
ncbi:phytanoyl-CoA dioxygenase family protein [Ramlibacter humi]|uniref:Phytanoyl-CoA dioxygenase n=1 Tax=Ramlibacter humi TaxID=2530451 RepID=A0A4Z0BZ44_9BURK|nr:phytanoyl-CoA dioxygenase family protein [Ramlibacter humi]TFZ03814.1 hypothetical protein EZ216_09180 [Ramlibacter humi]